MTTQPILESSLLQKVISYPEPIGSVVVSNDGRLFFTVHPESRPQGNKLLEWVDGAAVPYPSGKIQVSLFESVLGLSIDTQHRLWVIDHGRQGFGTAKLLAFDLASGAQSHQHNFSNEIAPGGSFLQDLTVTADGRFIIISDGSIIGKNPSLIVYDIERHSARRVLTSHESVHPEDYVIQNAIRDLSYFGGIFSIKSGVNAVATDANGIWLYYAAINHGGLYRLPLRLLVDRHTSESALVSGIERYSDKPLSDGLTIDNAGNVLVTDVEHNAISIVGGTGNPRTLIRSAQIRWPAAVSIGPDGFLYIADSAFPELLLNTRDHIRTRGPYSIFRIDLNNLSSGPAAN